MIPAAWHELLLRLAGEVPDGLVADARVRLGAGDAAAAAAIIGFGARAGTPRLGPDDLGLLRDTLAAAGADPFLVDRLPRDTSGAATDWRFGPLPPAAGNPEFEDVDLTDPGPDDPLDLAAVGAAGPARGVWRAWRYPPEGVAWPPPKRVYLAVTDRHADAPGVAAAMSDALAAAGEPSPQVEVWGDGFTPPAYQRAALGCGALLAAADEPADLRLAATFDRIDPDTGPGFDPRHPVVAEDERGPLLARLRAGTALAATVAATVDVMAGGREPEVPAGLRTDGSWIWSDAVAYYLQRHGLAPEPEFLAYLSGPAPAAPVDEVGLHRARLAVQLLTPGEVWVTQA